MFHSGDASSCGSDKAFVGTVWSSVASNGLASIETFEKLKAGSCFAHFHADSFRNYLGGTGSGYAFWETEFLMYWHIAFFGHLERNILSTSWTCVKVSNLGRVKDWTFSDGWGTSSRAFVQAHWECLWRATLLPVFAGWTLAKVAFKLQINISNLGGFLAAPKQCIRLR